MYCFRECVKFPSHTLKRLRNGIRPGGAQSQSLSENTPEFGLTPDIVWITSAEENLAWAKPVGSCSPKHFSHHTILTTAIRQHEIPILRKTAGRETVLLLLQHQMAFLTAKLDTFVVLLSQIINGKAEKAGTKEHCTRVP
ncbi:hypothetical protein DV515_00008334 [Chloebia gouldiae]|uniref:Uncharacterized protein n=1 Tax=Chloebia gouldiae TaxID=44316 RepID=A0A3L8SG03_CHLGU|nr:hypothetical protein DV515_00008334 [Chloebia gouldiae]